MTTTKPELDCRKNRFGYTVDISEWQGQGLALVRCSGAFGVVESRFDPQILYFRERFQDSVVEKCGGANLAAPPECVVADLILECTKDAVARPPGSLVYAAASTIAPQETEWLWKNRIPRGKLALLVGDPGVGKSFLTCDFAARLSSGLAWPDGVENEAPSNVVIVAAEDAPSDTIVPRVSACGATLENIQIVQGVRRHRDSTLNFLDITHDIDAIANCVDEIGNVSLVVIDPLASFLGGHESYRNAEVRGILDPLGRLAAAKGCCVLLVSHLRKGEGRAIYRAMGSLAITALARSVWLAVKDASFPSRRFMVPIKNNTGDDETGFAYSIQNGDRRARIVWEPDPLDEQADTLLEKLARPVRGNETPGGAANPDSLEASAIREILQAGPLERQEVLRIAKERYNHSERSLCRAAKELGVVFERRGANPGIWSLPE
jgi:hypothetical protein